MDKMRKIATKKSKKTVNLRLKRQFNECVNFFKDTPIAFYWLDRDGFFLGVNDFELTILGYKDLKDLFGRHSSEVASAKAWKNSQKVMKQNKVAVFEEGHLSRDGIKYTYFSIKKPLHDNSGKVVGLIGISVDITAHKHNEEKLNGFLQEFKAVNQAQNIAFDAFFNYIPVNFYWLDKSGNIVWCNNNQLKEFHIDDFSQIKGKHVSEVSPQAAWQEFQKVMESKKAEVVEEFHVRNGHKIVYLSAKSPVLDEKQNLLGLIGISIDITARKRVETLLIREKESVERYSKTMELISGCIAREMKIPLAIINLNNDLLGIDLNKKDLDLNSSEERNKISGYHDNVKFAVRSADNVIGMLLMKLQHVTKTQLGPGNFEFQSMKSLINNALKEYPFLKRERSLIHWEQETISDFKYFGDKDLTKNILFNLIKNALRAIKEFDKGEIFITLKTGDKFNYLIFKDTGMGIAKEHLETLFQKFSSHAENGTGLGLAFCKMVMNSYGGDITCKAKKDEYTEFALSFPKEGGGATTLKQKLALRKDQDF